MLFNTAQSVSAMAEFCAPNEHDSSAFFELVLQSGSDSEKNDQDPGDPNEGENNSTHDDECVDCTDCQCCAHLALTRLDMATGFQTPNTLFINDAPAKPFSNDSPPLRPPRV